MNSILNDYPNFRDIGGVQTKNGGTVKTNLLFRSGFLSELKGKDLAQFEDLDIERVIDLRTSDEVQLIGSGNYPGSVQKQNIPLNSGNITKMLIPIFEKGEFQLIEKGLLGKIYIDMISKFEEELRQIFQSILEADSAVVYHCSHGKDRTGLVSALLLELLEVDRDQIYDDYLKSNELRAKENAYQIQMIKDNFMKRFDRNVTDEEFAPVQELFVCQKDVLENVFEHIESNFESINNYFEENLGFTKQEISNLKSKYIL